MNQGKYVFSQVMTYFPRRVFEVAVEKYNGDFHAKNLNSYSHCLHLMFGQMGFTGGLRINDKANVNKRGQVSSSLALVKNYFSLVTPLNGVPSCFTSIKRPVSLSRFTHCSVLGLKT